MVTLAERALRNHEVLEFVGHEGYFRNTTVLGSITGGWEGARQQILAQRLFVGLGLLIIPATSLAMNSSTRLVAISFEIAACWPCGKLDKLDSL